MIVLGLFNFIAGKIVEQAVKQVMGPGGVGREFTQKALDSVMEVGKKELAKSVETVKRQIELDAIKNNPARLSNEIIKLAGRNKGTLMIPQIMAEFALPEHQAYKALQSLMEKDICILQYYEDQKVFLFPGFLTKKKVKHCEYCDGTYGLKEVEKNECPSCGAPLIITTIFE